MIWDLITGFLPNVWPWILGALGIGAAYLTGRSGGAAKVKRRQAEDRVETMEKANEVRNAIDAKSDAAVRGDLGKWVRPE
jgi:hypothetical protein